MRKSPSPRCFLHELVLAAAAFCLAPAALAIDGKIGIIGDSMAAGTHSFDACGRRDIVDCITDRGGYQDRDWSYAGGAHSWSIASRLGFSRAQVVDAAEDGEEWKDALDQARLIVADHDVNTVFIGLGANDVCQKTGYDYGGDLEVVAGYIDQTLGLLTDSLPPGATIYWTGVPDVVHLFEMLRERDHNLLFENCQATWDLDAGKIKDGAAADACDHYFDNNVCGLIENQEQAKDWLMELFLNALLDSVDVEEGPCGKVLNSRATDQDRREAQEFTRDLNRLMAEKAREFSGRKGVRVIFSDEVFRSTRALGPEHISRVDCYHPSRAGQVFLADRIWSGFGQTTAQAVDVFFEDFSRRDYCPEGAGDADACWSELNDDDDPTSGDVRIGDQRLQIRDNDRGLERALPLGRFDRAWLSFNWAREDLDRAADYVAVDISPDGGATWIELDRFAGDANDFGLHRGDYYDISDYVSSGTRIRFLASSGLGSEDRVLFDDVQVLAWNDEPEIAWHEAPSEGSVQSGVSLIRGWACDADEVSIVIDDGEEIPIAYGSQRGDTAGVCGDSANGYGMVIAWGLLGSGTHRLRTIVDGAGISNVEFDVVAIGDGFVEGLEAEYELGDFPVAGERVRIRWSEADQNFLITGHDTGDGYGGVGTNFRDPSPTGTHPDAEAAVGGAHHESPAQHSVQSGVGLIRGWACDAGTVAISIDGGERIPVAYGTSRRDTEGVCGDADNGFGMVFAWGLLGSGVHRMQTYVDGVEIANVEFEVVAIGDGFVTGLEGGYRLPGFPAPDESVDVRWSEADQNFRIVRHNF